MKSHPHLPVAQAMVFPPDVARPPPRKLVWPEPDSLVILHAPDEAFEHRRYPLEAVTTIGRASSNDIVLDDDSVSRRHAKIERREDGWWLVDESRHGTYVNRQQVREGRVRLDHHLDIGRYLLLLIRADIPTKSSRPSSRCRSTL